MENTVKNTGKEKSDMLTMLENLERMFDAVRYCFNLEARELLMKAMAFEAWTLAVKLELMQKRWEVYLPFEESADVDFGTWCEKARVWHKFIDDHVLKNKRNPWYEPSVCFWSDLYKLTVTYQGFSYKLEDPPVLRSNDEFPEYDYRNVNLYLFQGACVLADMMIDKQHVAKISSDCVNMQKEQYEMMKSCVLNSKEGLRAEKKDVSLGVEAVDQDTDWYKQGTFWYLADMLDRIENFLNSQLSDEQYERLSNLMSIGMRKETDSDSQFTQWKSSLPQSQVPKKAQQKKQELRKELFEMRFGEELAEYINLDAPFLENNADFGRFLFKNRKKLEREEVKKVYLCCRKIQLVNEILHPKEEKVADQTSQPRKLNKVEQQILDQLMDLAEKGNWTQGATVESIQAGMKLALGVGDPLPEELLEQSDQLWWLFQNRPVGICNDAKERRIMITWLNIAGWCVKKGILKGGTDNDICKRFFPNCGDKDYMNVSRGRKDSVKTFVEIHKLLETCLLPKQS